MFRRRIVRVALADGLLLPPEKDLRNHGGPTSALEKWMRDAKINDLFEGTGQINRLIIARRLLGYSSQQLK